MISFKNLQDINDVLKSVSKSLLIFHANWSPSCNLINKNINELSKLDNPDTQIVLINIDNNQGLLSKFNIDRVPTFIFCLKDKEIKRHAGTMNFKSLKEFISVK